MYAVNFLCNAFIWRERYVHTYRSRRYEANMYPKGTKGEIVGGLSFYSVNSGSHLLNIKITELGVIYIYIYKVKESRNRSDVTQSVPERLGSQISVTFCT